MYVQNVPVSRVANGNRWTPRQSPASQRTDVANRMDNSASDKCRVPHLGSPQLLACNSHAGGLDRDRRTSRISLENPNIPAAPPTVFADCAHLIAETCVQNHSFGANSRASRVGASALFISVAFWVCLDLVAAR